jgi:hypothetical protein
MTCTGARCCCWRCGDPPWRGARCTRRRDPADHDAKRWILNRRCPMDIGRSTFAILSRAAQQAVELAVLYKTQRVGSIDVQRVMWSNLSKWHCGFSLRRSLSQSDHVIDDLQGVHCGASIDSRHRLWSLRKSRRAKVIAPHSVHSKYKRANASDLLTYGAICFPGFAR